MSLDFNKEKTAAEMRKKYNPQFICSEMTEMVVEGYPRSSNTFTVDFLSLLLKRAGKAAHIAHHTHDVTNLLLGLKMGVPAVVLLRNPVDAVASFMIYSNLGVEEAVTRYVDFYRPLLSVRKRTLIVPFEVLTGDFNLFVTALNERFGMTLPLSEDMTTDSAKVKEVEAERGKKIYAEEDYASRVAVPNEERKAKAESVRTEVEAYFERRPQALNIYNTLSGEAIGP